jgi:hypothetical protein
MSPIQRSHRSSITPITLRGTSEVLLQPGAKRVRPRARQAAERPSPDIRKPATATYFEKLTDQLEAAQRELEIQLARIAQMQQQIDELRAERTKGKP